MLRVIALEHSSPGRPASGLVVVQECSSAGSSSSSARQSSPRHRTARCSWGVGSRSVSVLLSARPRHRHGLPSLLPPTGGVASALCTTVRFHELKHLDELKHISRTGCFFVGAIPASGIMVGTQTMNSTWSWRLPLLLQVRPILSRPTCGSADRELYIGCPASNSDVLRLVVPRIAPLARLPWPDRRRTRGHDQVPLK